MNEEQVKKYLKENDIQKIKFAFADIDGVLRGKVIHPKKFIDGLETGYGFCDVVWGWDSGDACYDNVKLTGWHTGYPDAMAVVDVQTFRQVPWESDTPFFLADFFFAISPPLLIGLACSRQLARRPHPASG